MLLIGDLGTVNKVTLKLYIYESYDKWELFQINALDKDEAEPCGLCQCAKIDVNQQLLTWTLYQGVWLKSCDQLSIDVTYKFYLYFCTVHTTSSSLIKNGHKLTWSNVWLKSSTLQNSSPVFCTTICALPGHDSALILVLKKKQT